jgi:hypothetical protein
LAFVALHLRRNATNDQDVERSDNMIVDERDDFGVEKGNHHMRTVISLFDVDVISSPAALDAHDDARGGSRLPCD